jgi:hypothetical protein
MEDVFRKDLPNIEQVQERDLHGRNQEKLCVNNPNYRNFFFWARGRFRAFL